MATISETDFFDKLPIKDYTFELSENLLSSKTGNGQLLVSSIGPRLWQGTVTLAPMSIQKYRQILPLLQNIQRPDNTFLIYDKKSERPLNAGSTSFGAIRVSTTTTASTSLGLNGLPANYKIAAGDYVSVIHNAVHRLFRVRADVTANASGVATVSLVHPVPAGIASNTTVKIIKATVTARYMPNSMNTGTVTLTHAEGISFSWIQTFKP